MTIARSASYYRWLLVLILTALQQGCRDTDHPYSDRLLVFGTLVDITLYDVSAEQGLYASKILTQQLTAQHAAWHAWEGQGELITINRQFAAGKPVTVSPELMQLIKTGSELAHKSGERFNPAIGRLITLWGFQKDIIDLERPPQQSDITAILKHRPSMTDLRFNGNSLISMNAWVQLDCGAFAKGYAVDKALETLRNLGIKNAIVNAGGDIKAIGRPGKRPWHIGIRDPRGNGAIASVDIDSGESIFTSGAYERYFEFEGQRYHHILNPYTGYPAAGITSATVIHSDATVADAAATALLVAGVDEWTAVAHAMGIRYVMLIDSAGQTHLSPAMAERVRFEKRPAPKVILSAPL